MWSYYAGYQNARLRASSDEYSDASSFREETFLSMAAAPWRLENLSRTSVWLPVIIVTGAKIVIEALSTTGKNVIWTTGQAYLGQTEVPVFVGILANLAIAIVNYSFTAIGEESVFRGIGYEEMKISLGQLGAFLADSTLFAGIHVPYEFQQGKTGSQLALNYATRFGTTFFLDWAYDDGGLQASVAEHLWLDVSMDLVSYLFNAGVPC
jgi:membrane protease YdiL (CAAX protease family)